MRQILSTLILFSFLMVCNACEDEINPKSVIPAADTTAVAPADTFARGADVSWLTQLESEGQQFYGADGMPYECMQLLRDQCGVNAIRLRVWVNPAEGWNNMADVLVKARRAHKLGLRLMIDFHFSDTWADPGNQQTPAAWANYDITQLKAAVADHVSSMLKLLANDGITPEWVQIGNETRGGMLYPLGQVDNGTANLAELTNAGYDAVKAISKDIKVIVHLDSGDKLWLYTRMFDYLKAHGGRYDMIGMSLYPGPSSWQQMVDACVSNIATIYEKYGKPVMICEVGMDYDQADACKQCISSLMQKGRATGHLAGIFYWEPEAPAGYNDGYKKGCFNNGSPTVALDAFK